MMIIQNYVIVKLLKVRFHEDCLGFFVSSICFRSLRIILVLHTKWIIFRFILERPEFLPKVGGRCMKLNPDGLSVAIGDRNGNIRILNLEIFQQITLIEAHDSEVLSVDYSYSSDMGLLILYF